MIKTRFFSDPNHDKKFKKPKKNIFNKSFFKDKTFYIKDLIRDINRLGKKREERVNVIYMDDTGAIHPTTGYLSFENVEFYIGSLKITKGIKETIKDKCFIADKLFHYYFIPAIFYENMSFLKFLSKDSQLKIDNLDLDRLRIVENDITKTAMLMGATESGILRTFVIVAFLGGLLIGFVVDNFLHFIL